MVTTDYYYYHYYYFYYFHSYVVELEKLNKASEEINRLELELDDARASFRQTLSESTQKLDVLAKKLGSCVEKARPYYDSRVRAKEAHLETQRAALRFERACSMHEAAKEMVQLAEQGYMRREQPSDPAWQEMLNHATMKVNEAEKERNESELEHQKTMIRFKITEDQVQALQKELKRAIAKSKPYFEMKAKFNQIMEEHKHKVSVLEEDVSSAKSLYSTALRSLEAISDEIHRQRMERRQQQQLGVRGAGSERSETELSELESVSATQSPTKPRSRRLNVPSSMDMADDSSDTESLASTGPMLDDEQVEFLTMDFSDALEKDRDDDPCGTYPMFLRRTNWSRMSLPPRLSHLEGYLLQAKRMSGDVSSPDANMSDSPTDEERAEVRELIEDLKEEEEDGATEPDSESRKEGEDQSGRGQDYSGSGEANSGSGEANLDAGEKSSGTGEASSGTGEEGNRIVVHL
nr:hypothetical protein BaRGS_030424 [Batillaria attramentaria]